MSKRYVIQVFDFITDENASQVHEIVGTGDGDPGTAWFNVRHPSGGDWLTRSSSTAIADAAKLVHEGETRELRIGISRPVYAVTPAIDFEQILAAKAEINWTADIFADTDEDDDEDYDGTDEDEEEDAEYDGEDDDGSENDAPIAFELVDETAQPLDVVELESDVATSDGNAHNNN